MNIEFTYSPLFLGLCFAFAGAFSWWMYRNLRVQMPTMLRFFLLFLRFCALFLLCLLLLEPLLTSIFETRIPPVVALVVDDSESMAASTDSSYVRKELTSKLAGFVQKLSDKGIFIQVFSVGDELRGLASVDSLKFRQSATNLSKAFDQLADRTADQNLGAIVLVSDGIYTQGANPIHHLNQFNIPVHTVLVGDTTPVRDLLIEAVQYNELTYLNTETPILVRVKSQGYGQVDSRLDILSQGKVIQSFPVSFSGSASGQIVEFRVRTTQPGLQQFQLRLSPQPDELNFLNNERLFYIKVLENRLNIGLFAGGPHPDLGAFQQSLGRDPRFRLSQFIRKNDREFYLSPTPDQLGKLDLIILHNFPAGIEDRQLLEQIHAEVERRNLPILHIVGSSTRFNILPSQSHHMALFPTRVNTRSSEAFLYFTPDYKNHSTWRFEDEKALLAWLETAPPLVRNDSEWKAAPGANVYGKAKIKGIPLDYPFFALQEQGVRKNAVLIGENLWRLRMHNFFELDRFDEFDTWMFNLLQWLSTREDNRRFRVYPSKNQFEGKEPVLFKGQAYDDSNMPIDGADIRITVTNPEGRKTESYLRQVQRGTYLADLGNLPAGAYTYVANGTYRGQQLGRDAGQFSVGKSALEFADLTAKPSMLRQLAQRSGGSFALARQLDQVTFAALERQDNLKPLIELKKTTMGLNQYLWPLLLALILLAVEWVVRKRYGLV
jgi:hypothetical protein